MIYADHAATTRLSECAYEAMIPWIREEYGNPSQPYSFSRAPHRAIAEARETIAACIGALPDEIFFTAGGTESDNWAIKGTMLVYGDHRCLITDTIEHHAVLNSCAYVERMGYPVTYLFPSSTGVIQPEFLRQRISSGTKLVSIMMANNEIGTIEPIRELAMIAHEHGALFHTDAVQAVGHIPINVHELQVDLLSASAHKFYGPKGVGFLYIRKGVSIEPLLSGGSQENGLRAGTENVASIVGMAAALKHSCDNIEHRYAHLTALRNRLLSALSETGLEYVVNGGDHTLPGIISISIKNADGERLLHRLDLMGIQVSTGAACNSTTTQLSHVLSAISLPDDYAAGTIRVSLGYDNTLEEVETIVAAIAKICRRKTDKG